MNLIEVAGITELTERAAITDLTEEGTAVEVHTTAVFTTETTNGHNTTSWHTNTAVIAGAGTGAVVVVVAGVYVALGWAPAGYMAIPAAAVLV
jgi:hypothetical protein